MEAAMSACCPPIGSQFANTASFPCACQLCCASSFRSNVNDAAGCRSAQLKGPEGAEKLLVVTIFAAQAPEQQMAVFQAAPAGTRKVRHALIYEPTLRCGGKRGHSIMDFLAKPGNQHPQNVGKGLGKLLNITAFMQKYHLQ